MCLLVAAFGIVTDTPLLIGANRDELLDRPTTVLTALRPSGPRILGGRDDHSGGTWLAVNQFGVVAALTNQPLGEAKDLTKRTRGELPLALAGHADATSAARALLAEFAPSDYNGCWLLVGDRGALYFIDFTGLVEPAAVALPAGLHVLENKPLGAPSSKADRMAELLAALPDDAEGATEALEGALADHWAPNGPPPAEGERPVMPNCVHLEHYGTRSSCTIRVPVSRTEFPHLRVADGPPCVTPFADTVIGWDADGS